MCHDELVANISESSLLSYQKITILIFRLVLQNFALPGCFPYILIYNYIFSLLSSGWFVIAACGLISVQGTSYGLMSLCKVAVSNDESNLFSGSPNFHPIFLILGLNSFNEPLITTKWFLAIFSRCFIMKPWNLVYRHIVGIFRCVKNDPCRRNFGSFFGPIYGHNRPICSFLAILLKSFHWIHTELYLSAHLSYFYRCVKDRPQRPTFFGHLDL